MTHPDYHMLQTDVIIRSEQTIMSDASSQ